MNILTTSALSVVFLASTTEAFLPAQHCRPTTKLASSLGTPSQDLLDLFNDQITKELAASQFYLSASVWFNAREWEGMAQYMLSESTDERGHALSFVDFANKRNIPIQLHSIEAPPSTWETPEDVWKASLELEQSNTHSLLQVAQAANKCQDFAVMAFLNPFHMEQVDSEDKISTIIAKVTDENRTPGLLRQLDYELGLEAGSAWKQEMDRSRWHEHDKRKVFYF